MTSLPYLYMLFCVVKVALPDAPDGEKFDLSRSRVLPFLLLCAPLALVIVGADVMRWVSAMCIDMALVVAFLYCYSPNRAAVKERLSRLIAQDRFMVALAFTLMIGPFGQIAGNRLIAKLGTMAGVLN